MIDYDFEARLVDRIAAREAIAAELNQKQRRILLHYTRYGETYREISKREGLSVERIRQHHFRSMDKLRAHLAKVDRPQPTRRNIPPPFDKAAFLRHMRLLIELRERHAIWERQEEARREREAVEHAAERERREFARERAEVARLIAREKVKNEPPPPLPFDSFSTWPAPSYAPPQLPTQDGLCAMAHEALRYLLLAHPQHFTGTPWLGKWATSVVFTRDGGSVSEAVNSIVRELPAQARLSAYPVPIEQGTLGANATTPYAALRVTVTPDGLKLRFDVTWD